MYLKILAVLIVFIQIALFGYLPYLLSNIGKNQRIISLVGCFAGGLFLTLALLHILPEANQELSHYFSKTYKIQSNLQDGSTQHQMQWGSLIAMLTFVGVLAIEAFVTKYISQKQPVNTKKNDDLSRKDTDNKNSQNFQHLPHLITSASSSVFLTQLALSIHAFIQCMALGSQTTDKATLTLLIGIGCHKWAEGLTLGFQYERAKFSAKLALKFCLFHAFLNAGAVLLGWVFSNSSQLMSGILGAISAGTFLYVSTIQKIQEQFSDSQRLPQKIILMLSGIGFVCLII